MPDIPWDKWFWADWLNDDALTVCADSTRGIWADAVSRMMQRGTDNISGSYASLSKLCRTTPGKMRSAVADIKLNNVADVSECNGIVTLASRRRQRETHEREKTRERVHTFRKRKRPVTDEKRTGNADVTDEKRTGNTDVPSDSDSDSSSSSMSTKKGDARGEQFERCWIAYGMYGVKKKALTYWRTLSNEDRDAIEAAIPAYLECVAVGRSRSQFEGWINPQNSKWDMDWIKCRADLVTKAAGPAQWTGTTLPEEWPEDREGERNE